MTRLLAACLAITCFWTCFWLTTPAAAHRQPEVETTIELVRAETGEVLQITHRMHAHDAQRVLRLLGVEQPRLSAPKDQARLALYARDHLDLTGDAVSEIVGVEVDGDHVFIYQLHPEMAGVEGSTLLSDVAPSWSNRVHLKGPDGQPPVSATFSADSPRAEVPVMLSHALGGLNGAGAALSGGAPRGE